MFKQLRLPLNLQLFAEGDAGGAVGTSEGTSNQAPAPATTEPTSSGQSLLSDFPGKPSWGLPNAGQGQAPLTQVAPQAQSQVQAPPPSPQQPQQQTEEFIDFAGRKVPVVDPILKDIHRDYTNLQSTYTQTTQRARELEQHNQQLMAALNQFMQQQTQAQQQPPQPQGPSPEEVERMKEDFMNKFYENPMDALGSIVQQTIEKTVKPMVEPIHRERQFVQEVNTLMNRYQDFNDMAEPMKEVLRTNPALAEQPGGLETAYFIAKGKTAGSIQQPTPEQLLADPNFVQQHVLSNEQIRNQILTNYLQNKQQTNLQTPVVMAGQPGGTPPSMPEKKPTTIREGSRALLRHLGLGGG